MTNEQEGYNRWRKNVQWTDEEIALALESLILPTTHPGSVQMYRSCAAQVRAGRLSRKIFHMALPALVKTCGICGGKAIYILGVEGRCSKCRHIKSQGYDRCLAKAEKNRGLRDKEVKKKQLARKLSEIHHAAKGKRN